MTYSKPHSPRADRAFSSSETQITTLIEDARSMAADGRHQAARTLFAAGVVLEDGTAARNAYGCYLFSVEEYESAIEQFTILLEKSKREESAALWAVASNNLAAIYRAMGDSQTAADYQRQSITAECRLDDNTSDNAALACDFSNRATDAILAGQYELASRLLQQSLTLEADSDTRLGEASDWGNLGILLALNGELTEAIPLLWRAYRLHVREKDFHGAGTDLLNLAEFFHDLGRWKTVVSCRRRAIEHFERAGAVHSLSKAKRQLIDAIRVERTASHDPLLN